MGTALPAFSAQEPLPPSGSLENCTTPTELEKRDEAPKPAKVLSAAGEARVRAGDLLRPVFSHAAISLWSVSLALAAGVALRLFFILVYPDFDGDSEIYGTIAKNMLLHHAYALDGPFRSTLIRMPGYPVFMALVFSVFGIKNYFAVRYAQAVVDLGTCLLIAGFARDHAGARAGLATLWIACLCPFTADYVAVPMSETPSIFCVALGLFAAGRLVNAINSGAGRRGVWLLLTTVALICAVGLRPDGALLAGAIIPGVWWYTRKRSPSAGIRAAVALALLTLLPLIPWTIRNYRVFHVVQPLAPRSALDPTELSVEGFNHWTTTWEADLVSLGEIWWRGDDLTIDIHLLPSRAFDSEAEYRQTAKLIADYNELCTITPEIDARFEALAEQRIRRHPLRQYIELPFLRLTDMWLRPRTEYLEELPLRWWEWRLHPEGSLIAIGYALLNALLLAAAFVGFLRGRAPFRGMLLAYVLMRCAVLWRMPNAEPRYTLEAFPIVIVAAGMAWINRLQGDKVTSEQGSDTSSSVHKNRDVTL